MTGNLALVWPAMAAAFLASDDARMITAENLSVDAGMQWF